MIQRDGTGVRRSNAHFVLGAVNDETGRVRRNQKRREPFFAQLRVRHGKHDGQFGAFAIADKLLGAVDHPLAIAQFCPCAQVVRFGARLWFGEAEATDALTAGQFGQPRLFLRLTAIFENGAAAHRVVNAHQRACCAVTCRNLFDRQGIGDIVHVGATPFFGDDHAE